MFQLLRHAMLFWALSAPVHSQEEDADAIPEVSAEISAEIVVEAERILNRSLKRGFDAFRSGSFEVARAYFQSVRRDEFRRKGDNFTDWLNMAPNAIRGNGRMSGKHLAIRTSDPWRQQAYAILYYMEGMSELAQGETASASRSFKMALDMNPRHFDARADYALTQISLEKPKKAEKHIKRLAKDLRKCDANDEQELCASIKQRLQQVEVAYGDAISG